MNMMPIKMRNNSGKVEAGYTCSMAYIYHLMASLQYATDIVNWANKIHQIQKAA